jgi:superfamily II DNA or RNA helicase
MFADVPKHVSQVVFRDYQKEGISKLMDGYGKFRSQLGVFAVGLGKSLIMAAVGHSMAQLMGGRAMCLDHRFELGTQNAEAVQALTGVRPNFEKASLWADEDSDAPIVGSIQTLARGLEKADGRTRRIDPKSISLLSVDEGHHAAARTYRKVIEWYMNGNPNGRVLGVTGTPKRGDGIALRGIFDNSPVDYPLDWSIDHGWNVPIFAKTVHINNYDISAIRTNFAGDFMLDELDALLSSHELAFPMAKTIIERAEKKKTIVFCAGVHQAEILATIIQKMGAKAEAISGKSKDRHNIFSRFKSGDTRILTNACLATEGFNVVDIEVVVLAKPTKSLTVLTQSIGRGVRPLAGVVDGPATADARKAAIESSGKPRLDVYDFVGVTGQHKLCSAADALAGTRDAQPLIDEATDKVKEADSPVDVMKLLRAIRVREAKENQQKKEMRAAQHAEFVGAVNLDVQAEDRVVDLFDLYDWTPPKKIRVEWQKPPTQKMIDILARYDIDAHDISIGDAGKLIQKLKGKPSMSQIRCLLRAGYSKREIKDLSRDDVSKLITACKQNGWQRPSVYSQYI